MMGHKRIHIANGFIQRHDHLLCPYSSVFPFDVYHIAHLGDPGRDSVIKALGDLVEIKV
jgi:hypothetical protein